MKAFDETNFEACGSKKNLQTFILLMTTPNPKDELLVHGCNMKNGIFLKVLFKEVSAKFLNFNVSLVERPNRQINMFNFESFINIAFCFCKDFINYSDDCLHGKAQTEEIMTDYKPFYICIGFIVICTIFVLILRNILHSSP